eukprot:Skav213951  [mRNA]  locus=scaffold1979:102291:107041:- [translate_table: standard]
MRLGGEGKHCGKINVVKRRIFQRSHVPSACRCFCAIAFDVPLALAVQVSQSNLLKLLPAERLDLVGVQSSTWQDFLSSVFVDLDSPHSGGEVLLKHCLIAVALLLGETLEEKASAIFSMLEFNGLCAQADFEELAEAAGQEALARKWLDSNEITEDGLDAKMFHKAPPNGPKWPTCSGPWPLANFVLQLLPAADDVTTAVPVDDLCVGSAATTGWNCPSLGIPTRCEFVTCLITHA